MILRLTAETESRAELTFLPVSVIRGSTVRTESEILASEELTVWLEVLGEFFTDPLVPNLITVVAFFEPKYRTSPALVTVILHSPDFNPVTKP